MSIWKTNIVDIIFKFKEKAIIFEFSKPDVNRSISYLTRVATSWSSIKRMSMVNIVTIFKVDDKKCFVFRQNVAGAMKRPYVKATCLSTGRSDGNLQAISVRNNVEE